MTNAKELAERLASKALENERNKAKSVDSATQSAPDVSPYLGTKQNASKPVLTPQPFYRIIPSVGLDPITVFFHPPLTVAAVRQYFYKNATKIEPIENI